MLAASAVAVAAALALSGCSPEVGFPSVHDMPAPRADTPLTPDEVKQATDTLISERDHLSTATQGNGAQGNGQPAASANASGTGVPDAGKKTSAAAQPAAQNVGADGPVTAGAYAKP